MCYCDGSSKNVRYFSRVMLHYRQAIYYLMNPIALSIFRSSYNDDAENFKRLNHLQKIVYIMVSLPFEDTFNCLHDM